MLVSSKSLKRRRRAHRSHLSSYPRRGFILWVRRILLWCWGIIALYAGNAVVNIITLLFNLSKYKGISAIIWEIVKTLVLPFPLDNSSSSAWTLAAFFLPLGLLLFGCIWAIKDKQYEHTLLQKPDVNDEEALGPKNNELHPPLPDAPFDTGLFFATEAFVERQEHLQWLLPKLRSGRGNDPIVLSGLPGVGKTALVAWAIRRLQTEERFLGGCIRHSCSGETDVSKILRKILGRFDSQHRFGEMKDDTVHWNDIASFLLQNKDVLIILDNVEPNVDMEKLLAPLLTVQITIVITLRHRYFRGLIPHKIGELSRQEALDLLMRSSGRSITSFTRAERAAAESIVKALGYHALAVRLAGAQVAYRDIEVLARELVSQPQQRLELPDGETPRSVALAFSESIKGLPDPAKKLFVALAAFPTDNFSRRAVLTLAQKLGQTRADAEHNLHVLIIRAMVETATEGTMPVDSDLERLQLHPLLRAFAAEGFAYWSQSDRETAFQAIAKYYADYSNSMPHSVLSVDALNITGALQWAHEQKEHDLEVTICRGMHEYWFNHPTISEGRDFLRRGVEAATALAGRTQIDNDFLRQTELRFFEAQMEERSGNIDEAEKIYQDNLKARRYLKDQRGENDVLMHLVQLALRRGQLGQAEKYYTQSISITRRKGDRDEDLYTTESARLGCLSEISWRRGRLEEAENYSKQSRAILRTAGELHQEAYCLIRLGNITHDRGRLNEAENYYSEAQHIIGEIQDRQAEGWLDRGIGSLALTLEKHKRADVHLQRAYKIFGNVQDQRGKGWALGDLGRLAQARKAFPQAEDCYQEAREIFRKVQDRHGESWVLGLMGTLAYNRGHDEMVERFCGEALKIAYDGEDLLNYAAAAATLGTFLIVKQGNRTEGTPLLSKATQIYVRMGLPAAERVLKTARRLRCV
jgi:tetratricopeptide (TPR) repeat protein